MGQWLSHLPAESIEVEKRRTVIYRTMNIEKEEIVTEEVEEAIEIRKDLFYTHGAK